MRFEISPLRPEARWPHCQAADRSESTRQLQVLGRLTHLQTEEHALDNVWLKEHLMTIV